MGEMAAPKSGSARRWPADRADGKPARVFPVSPEKQHALAARMRALGVREDELEEHFVRSGGKGGQNVNKVSTCVVLRHRPERPPPRRAGAPRACRAGRGARGSG